MHTTRVVYSSLGDYYFNASSNDDDNIIIIIIIIIYYILHHSGAQESEVGSCVGWLVYESWPECGGIEMNVNIIILNNISWHN
jgi:hypothetical protein